jgi:hypothetical protein
MMIVISTTKDAQFEFVQCDNCFNVLRNIIMFLTVKVHASVAKFWPC